MCRSVWWPMWPLHRLTLAADQARLQLAKDTLDSRIKAFELTRKMHELGSTSGPGWRRTRPRWIPPVAMWPTTPRRWPKIASRLELLVGGAVPAQWLPDARTLMDAQDVTALKAVPAPLPSTVLLKRPDVQAAERNLQAMNASIGAARAADVSPASA